MFAIVLGQAVTADLLLSGLGAAIVATVLAGILSYFVARSSARQAANAEIALERQRQLDRQREKADDERRLLYARYLGVTDELLQLTIYHSAAAIDSAFHLRRSRSEKPPADGSIPHAVRDAYRWQDRSNDLRERIAHVLREKEELLGAIENAFDHDPDFVRAFEAVRGVRVQDLSGLLRTAENVEDGLTPGGWRNLANAASQKEIERDFVAPVHALAAELAKQARPILPSARRERGVPVVGDEPPREERLPPGASR